MGRFRAQRQGRESRDHAFTNSNRQLRVLTSRKADPAKTSEGTLDHRVWRGIRPSLPRGMCPAPGRAAVAGRPYFLADEELPDVLAAEHATFHDAVANAGEHFLEAGADLTPTDQLAPSVTRFVLIHRGPVGGADGLAGQRHRRDDAECDLPREKTSGP